MGEDDFYRYYTEHILDSEMVSVDELVECYHTMFPYHLCSHCIEELDRRVRRQWEVMDKRSYGDRVMDEWKRWEVENNIISNEEFMERVMISEKKESGLG